MTTDEADREAGEGEGENSQTISRPHRLLAKCVVPSPAADIVVGEAGSKLRHN